MVRAARGLLSVIVLCSIVLCSVVLPGGWLAPPAAHGQRGRLSVAVGDTGARVGGELAAAALEEALHVTIAARPDLREEGHPGRARYVVTGSVTELRSRPTAEGHEVHIAVSIIVADRGGSVRAMLAGRAGASGEDVDRLTENALRAAVRSAIRPLGETLR